jgi:hypothetical protein
MVSAEHTDAEDAAAERRVQEPSFSPCGLQPEEQYKRRPDSAVQHLRPISATHVSAESERKPAEYGGRRRTAEFSAETIEKNSAKIVNQNEVVVEEPMRYEPIVEGCEKQ